MRVSVQFSNLRVVVAGALFFLVAAGGAFSRAELSPDAVVPTASAQNCALPSGIQGGDAPDPLGYHDRFAELADGQLYLLRGVFRRIQSPSWISRGRALYRFQVIRASAPYLFTPERILAGGVSYWVEGAEREPFAALGQEVEVLVRARYRILQTSVEKGPELFIFLDPMTEIRKLR